MLLLLFVVAASRIDAVHLPTTARASHYAVGGWNHTAAAKDPVKKVKKIFNCLMARILGKEPPSELTIATLNIGGDGPQPEYIAKDWTKDFGKVEKMLGGTILALHYCKSNEKNECIENLPAKYTRYLSEYLFEIDNRLGLGTKKTPPMYIPKDTLLAILTKYIKKETLTTLYEDAKMDPGVTFAQFAKYMFDPKNEPIVFEEIVVNEATQQTRKVGLGLSALDKNPACKRRLSFPFFGKGFMKMDSELRAGDYDVKKYKDSIKDCPHLTTGKFLPLLIFDLLVFDHYQNWFDGKPDGQPIPDPIKAIHEPDVNEEKQRLVQKLLPEVEILMLQEAESALVEPTEASLQKATLKKQEESPGVGAVATASGGHYDEKTKTTTPITYDTAILATHALGTTDKAADGKNLYTRWTAFVTDTIAKEKGSDKVPWRNPTKGPSMAMNGLTGASAVSVATTHVDGHRVLLMSMHPNSNGRPCVLFAHLAKEFYNMLNVELNAESGGGGKHKKFELLLVGGDWNVMTADDKKEKLEKEVKEKAELTAKNKEVDLFSKVNGFEWHEFQEAVADDGFDLVHAKDKDGATATVNKVRTFLQTQFAKVAKVDKTTKDVLLAYPKDLVKVKKVFVLNEVKPEAPGCHGIHGKFGLLGGDVTFPTQNWVLDHFATYARIMINWKKEDIKQKKDK